MEKIKVTRKTTESEMNVVLDFAPLKKDYRKYIKTPIPFLNHMIEHIAWRGEVNMVRRQRNISTVQTVREVSVTQSVL